MRADTGRGQVRAGGEEEEYNDPTLNIYNDSGYNKAPAAGRSLRGTRSRAAGGRGAIHEPTAVRSAGEQVY